MSWKQSRINGPVNKELKSVIAPINNALGAVAPILSAAEALLNVAKVFVQGQSDPFSSILDGAISGLESKINDTFGTRFSVLTVNPFKLPRPSGYDSQGIPLLSPNDAIRIMRNSFDDLGDSERPQFSPSATVAAFGIMATGSNVSQLTQLMGSLVKLFAIPEWELALNILNQKSAPATPASASVAPDWESLALNSFSPFDQAQASLLGLLEAAKGTQISPTGNITELINMLLKKVKRIQELAAKVGEILDSVSGSASGFYVMDVPAGPGGVNRIKQSLLDPYLQQCVPANYTVAVLFVGGGPAVVAVDSLRKLLL